MSQLNVDTIAESSAGVGVSIVDTRTDTIEELTTGAGVTITGLKTSAPEITLPAGADADLTTATLGWIFTSGIAKTIGLARLAGFMARQFGIYVVTDPKFGAIGDGVADDTAAIQAALNAAALVCGVCYVPPGKYGYSSQITIPKGVTLKGAGIGLSSSVPGTRFVALASFPINTAHFVLGDTSAQSFASRIEDVRIFCSSIAGSIGVDMPTVQENSGLLRVLVQDYMSTGVRCIEPGGGLFADNWQIQDCQLWCSASATGSIGVDITTSHRDGVIRKLSVVPSGSPADQLAGVRIQAATGVDGGPVCYDVHVERHTDAISVSTNGSVRAYHTSNGVSGTNLFNISSSRDCVIVDAYRGTGTTTIANSIIGESVTTQRVAYYFASDTSEGYQIFHSAGGTSTHGNVMSVSGAQFMVKSTPTSGAASRSFFKLRDGNNDGWDIRFGADGSNNPLQFIPVTGGTPGSTMMQLDNAGRIASLPTTNGPVGTVTLSAAATTTVSNSGVTANSLIYLFPTNAAAATLVSGASSPYISAKSAGVSFTIATANAAAAAGTETFNYLVLN